MSKNNFNTVIDYLDSLPAEGREAIQKIRDVILNNIPNGFIEEMSYSMIGYVVPHTIYPQGYRCNTNLPLPFINLALQKNFIALYHMAIYADPELLQWFITEYAKYCTSKLDMGKSCIRFRNLNAIPYSLIGELVNKISVDRWIRIYEASKTPV